MPIRAAHPSEAKALSEIAFRSKAHWGYSASFMADCREELSITPEQIESSPTYVIENIGEPSDNPTLDPVGFYSLGVLSATQIELNHLFVEPGRIGRGEGRALFEHAVTLARARGFETLVIQSDPNAEGFYAACGATRVGERPSDSIPGRSLPLLHVELTVRA